MKTSIIVGAAVVLAAVGGWWLYRRTANKEVTSTVAGLAKAGRLKLIPNTGGLRGLGARA